MRCVFVIQSILHGKQPFCVLSPFWGLEGNAQCSTYAHWKARSGLPISVNGTFLLSTTAGALRANID